LDVNGLYRKNGFLAWPEFDEIKFSNGIVEIRKRGQKSSWARVRVPMIENLGLFLIVPAGWRPPQALTEGATIPELRFVRKSSAH
jgi:hypothetical protein